MIRYLKGRGCHVLFNTNGTLLTSKRGLELIDAGLDELRVSLDAAEPKAFALVRGRDMFAQILRNLRRFSALQRERRAEAPKVSLWLTGLRETIGQLPAFVRLADELGIGEVYLQRLVYFEEGQGLARDRSSLFEKTQESELVAIQEAEEDCEGFGHFLQCLRCDRARTSLKKKEGGEPWSLCRRPWTLMYFTAHGRAIPAASPPSPCAGMTASLWAMPPSRACGRSGMARAIRIFAEPCSLRHRRSPARIAACDGVFKRRGSAQGRPRRLPGQADAGFRGHSRPE